MKPGPPPKPIVIKRRLGNPGEHALNENEPMFPAPSRMPPVPEHLNRYAEDAWHRLGRLLLGAGLLTSADTIGLEMLCQSYGSWVHALGMIAKTGGEVLVSDAGNYYQNPWFHVANKAYDQMMRMLAQFGLTPAERSRVVAQVRKQEMSLAEMLFSEALGG